MLCAVKQRITNAGVFARDFVHVVLPIGLQESSILRQYMDPLCALLHMPFDQSKALGHHMARTNDVLWSGGGTRRSVGSFLVYIILLSFNQVHD